LIHSRKLKLSNTPLWPHHRGGWTAAVRAIYENLRAEDGTLFVPAVEELIAKDEVLTEPWIGFVHQVPHTTLKWYPDLERLLSRPSWLESAAYCQGIFTLSGYLRDYLLSRNISVPVTRILYPAESPSISFSLNRYTSKQRPTVLFIGEYLRNYQAFFDLAAPDHQKILLAPDGFKLTVPASVEVRGHVTDLEYDELLATSVVFLNLIDAPANTTVVECIARNTPLLVNRLPGVVEYLGENYPLYYDDIDKADDMLANHEVIARAEGYLQTLAIKKELTLDAFVAAIARSAVYRTLPVPGSQQSLFKSFDLTIVVCSYKRVYNIANLLKALTTQNTTCTFEIILWNNNCDEDITLNRIVADLDAAIDIRVIHSSFNYYCLIRLAVAQLMRSELLLICDDDVIPGPDYVAHFFRKHQEYGPDAVLCARGHVFRPHLLNEEDPSDFWDNYEHLSFYDETVDDRQVHFMHADNCLIPRKILKAAGQIDLPAYEFAIIDDYWLSFVISHELHIPIWKIRADGVLSFTPCSDDPGIALYHSDPVREQRVRFYVHHMRAGWPPGQISPSGTGIPIPDAGIPMRSVPTMQTTHSHDEDPWDSGFCGVNMYSESPEDDFRVAWEYGVRVVRLGAVCGAGDFRYLVDAPGEHFSDLIAVKARLTRTIALARRYGMKIIIAPSHLPGRLFTTRGQAPDLRMWINRCYRDRIVELWSGLARELREVDEIIGYDAINEPFSPEDTQTDFFDYTQSKSDEVLNELYGRIVEGIRRHDRLRRIILEAPCWASPLAVPTLRPIPDNRVVYSFHMYAPHRYTMRAENGGRYAYPGSIPRWSHESVDDLDMWDRKRIDQILDRVASWQQENRLLPRQIYVGEFGVSRDSVGAAAYLGDLTSLFRKNEWSWCLYAFRDEAWDAMDYELGEDRSNMLERRRNPLFDVVAKQFR
jgi:glycosyltransferase involved in cell wall biosynthesis